MGYKAVPVVGSTSINFPVYTNYFILGTLIVIDRPVTEQYCNVLNNFLTFTQKCDANIYTPDPSGYMRLEGVSTIGYTTRGILTILNDYATGPVGPWTAAESKHFGLLNFYTDPDNNYLLMISPAASALGERSIQLAKQVAGVETILDTDNYGGLAYNTEYVLELERIAGIVTGRVYDENFNLLATVSAADSDLSSGESGVHGFAVAYTVRKVELI